MAPSVPALLREVRACRLCDPVLPFGARPVLSFSPSCRLLVVGQAPGRRVHETGIPWNDPSGERLREWMGVGRDRFYDASRVAIVPMGFCYPGTGRSGDLPPRPECSETWMRRILSALPRIELALLIGRYAHAFFLGAGGEVAATVRRWREHLPSRIPLPHPSPRNNLWLRRNPWFGRELVPALRRRVAAVISPRA